MKHRIINIVIVLFFASIILSKNSIKNKTFKLGIVSTWNIKCGIAVYTKNIVDALHEKKIHPQVYGNIFDPKDLILRIKKDKISILNVQYKDGLYPNFNDLLFVLRYAKKKKIKIILTLHGTPPDILLQYVDRVILHKNIDNLSREKIKTFHIPMGTPVYQPEATMEEIRSKYGFSNDDKIIVTTGFMFGAKQHANILREMVQYLKRSPKIKVQLLTAFNDTALAECQNECVNIKRVIAENDLENQVLHITNFISQQELSERIWLSDIGYLWMDGNTHETSAATKEFIAGRTPLVVCDSNHFHDIVTGVKKTPSNKSLYVQAIFEVLESNQLENLSNEMEVLYQKTNYHNLIDTFIKVYFN